jgi:hypothetical protein
MPEDDTFSGRLHEGEGRGKAKEQNAAEAAALANAKRNEYKDQVKMLQETKAKKRLETKRAGSQPSVLQVAQAGNRYRESIASYFAENTGRQITLDLIQGKQVKGKIEKVEGTRVILSRIELGKDKAAYTTSAVDIDSLSSWQKIRLVKPGPSDRNTLTAICLEAEKQGESELAELLMEKIGKLK